MAVKVDKDVCIGCGACTGVCPTGAITLEADGKAGRADIWLQPSGDRAVLLQHDGHAGARRHLQHHAGTPAFAHRHRRASGGYVRRGHGEDPSAL